MSMGLLATSCTTIPQSAKDLIQRTTKHCPQFLSSNFHLTFSYPSSLYCSSGFCRVAYPYLSSHVNNHRRRSVQRLHVMDCLPSSSSSPPPSTSFASTKLYVSGLSFRTTQESLRNAFEKFGQLIEVNLVMDKIANRPRGFAFLRYATEEESKKAIEGMHGKFLDGRVIFVEVAKPRSSEVHKSKQNSRPSLQ